MSNPEKKLLDSCCNDKLEVGYSGEPLRTGVTGYISGTARSNTAPHPVAATNVNSVVTRSVQH